MITFLDENDVEYGALATIKATNAVNGERSLTGTIVSGDYVLSKIERGWRLRFDDEYYVVTYAKPIDEGKNVQVSFDAVHQFFWDFGKSSVYDQLSDGSHTFKAYLDFIFNGSGYKYDIETSLTVKAFEKQSFGYKNRLSLFNDIITSSGVEFQVNGKVVRILAKVGTDLSTVVRKNFNLNELGIEKNIGNFVTYQKGFGAYFDEEDHSKGRLIAEYTSPLASVYGKLEADPLVDERYKQPESLLSALKETVDNSYTISVSLDMEDLTRAGYRYTQPVAGDYIMAINETLGFKEKIRIVSFTSEYDVTGQLIKHTVTCNDIGSVKKLSASYTHTQHQAANAEVNANTAYEFANKALVSANGKNTNYYGDTFPVDNPKGTLKKGDLLFLTVGDTVKQYYWNGAEWVTNPVVSDVEAFKEQIAEELKDVPKREEFENKISEEIATSKAEIETQIESAKTQAESNAKEYADTINQETAKVAELANAAAGEIKADLVNVKNNLTATSLVANNAQAAVDEAKQELAEVNTKVDSAKEELTQAKQDLTEVASELSTAKQDLTDSVTAVNNKVDNAKEELTQAKQQLATVADDLSTAKQDFQNAVSAVDTKATNLESDLSQAKQDLTSQAQQLQAQANAQSELTNRVSTVEKTADGTKTTVNELTKTVAQNGKDITSVTARTKVVEDDLAGTKTTLSQVKTTADSTSQKTATLETGLDGLNAKFDSLKIGGRNLLTKTNQGKTNWSWTISSGGTTAEDYNVDGVNAVKLTRTSDEAVTWSYISYSGLLRNLIEPNTKYTLSFDVKPSVDVTFTASLQCGDGAALLTDAVSMNKATANKWTKVSCVLTSKTTLPDDLSQVVYLSGMPVGNGNWVIIKNIKLEKGNVATDYSPNEADIEQKVAEYKQTADQNYASLQTTVQNLDGTVQHNKAVADQTAQGFKTRIESLETYKDGESERADAYFESAKTETARQLTAERTAIAKDYVAKSTYTSDVTGIRNELSATTTTANATKTNLANYQASNDKMVASLKSSLQTTDGNVSNLQTKVEAVPGQITSAVSAVEGKIPTSIDTVNLVKNTGSAFVMGYGITNTTWNETKKQSILDFSTPGVNLANSSEILPQNGKFSDFKPIKGMTYAQSIMIDTDATFNPNGQMQCKWYAWNGGDVHNPQKAYIKKVGEYSYQVWSTFTWNLEDTALRAFDWVDLHNVLLFRTTGTYLAFYKPKLTTGNLPSDWSPSPEDYDDAISQVKSEIKQTADGITLLATKTELNSAKTELQSGINTATDKANNNAQTISTHTTQISALNTGLSAKVSQTDFNTLSGRVTTAENNITAKANELSSKITSVEGKIPASIGGRNLWIQSKVTGGFVEETLPDNHITGQKKCYRISNYQEISFNIEPDFSSRLYRKVTFSAWVKYENVVQGANNWNVFNCFKHELVRKNSSTGATTGADFLTLESFTGTSDWKYITYTYDYSANKSYDQLKTSLKFNLEDVKSGTVWVTGVKVEIGSIPSDYSPAPEDTAEQISNLSSEIKQTADGMTLLATKTELNSAKNELQSGINTATNKANTAQNTANNNAQTISTHTTQISALNTGLQAKVSQSDFNTLSGRVTTAENNITAKANELSSKITSVEGKIPTSIGGRNLLSKTNQGKTNWSWNISSGGATLEDFDTYGVNAVKMTRKSDAPVSWSYIQYSGLIRKLIEPNTKYTLSFDVKPSVDVTFTASLQCGDGAALLTDAVSMNKATANKWTKVSCVLTTKTTLPDDLSQVVYLSGMPIANGNTVMFKNIKLEKGVVSSDWSPAPEDAIEEISSLSSELTQTKDGITLLATKTELNNAKNELQSGINTATNKADAAQNTANSAQSTANNNAQTISTHTTQISALNTGLQAKVSQSEFNTLSGRVTNAENNITAKANELSSKITSVEGKIPTNLDSLNLMTGTRDWSTKANPWHMGENWSTENVEYQGLKVHSTQKGYNGSHQNIFVKNGDVVTFSFFAKATNTLSSIRVSSRWNGSSVYQAPSAGVKESDDEDITITSEWKRYSKTVHITSDGSLQFRTEYRGETIPSGNTFYVAGLKLAKTSQDTGYSENPTDVASQISSLSSEFKQTTDAIKASVSSVQTAASNAQSTANTAVSKADAAQAGVNTLDSTTVKSSSLTINADGIVMKAGKSTTDVANAIGSYFSVNQNAINLFSDKINVKGNMIVNGAITSDKIASKQINTAHLNGKIITADVISSNAVTADAIKAGAVTTDKMSANSINGDRIAAGTLDAAKIKAGSITASQIASGTITSNQIKAGGISAANIASGAITSDKIAANSIDASKIAANAITANMIRGGKLNSTNGATVFDLNAGTLVFNNNYGYIQRVASDKVFEITTLLGKDTDSRDYLTSAFNIRKSDNSRRAGVKFTLYNTIADKPTAEAKMNADAFLLHDSKDTRLFSVYGRSTFMGTFNMQDWGDIPVANIDGGLIVKDIGLRGHTESLLKVVETLCKKTNTMWL